jgi:site-specific DNA-methyltransferase (adenine-specific)
MGEIFKSADGAIELRCGKWQDVLADVESVDAVITDPPYGEHVHGGHNMAVGHLGAANNARRKSNRRAIDYAPLTEGEIAVFSSAWGGAASGWFVAMTDHLSAIDWAAALGDAGRYVFQPLPCVVPGSTVRLCGDGPSSWAVYAVAARPRGMMKWGTLPGAYIGKPESSSSVIGSKPLWLMKALVRDYSRPGDLICDPCAGSGTTLIAAAIEGRRAIGAEMDPETYAKAVKRIKRGYTCTLPGIS